MQNKEGERKTKSVVYQVFTRLFGNKNSNNKPWGTIEENGVGKFNDFTPKALGEIKDLGVTHIWYTGVCHHALISDYTSIGISNDYPEIVKGRAGSPYAVKDYYNVNPDLAVDPANRLEEFEQLIQRTHKAGLKVIMDIVPNHIARVYEGKNNPEGVRDFGVDDDVSVEYKRDNNFYYIPNTPFEVPDDILVLNEQGRVDKYVEFPAKWTGNGSRLAKPDRNDWYETVKINYGLRPDGSKDFPCLPSGFDTLSHKEHFDFWQRQDIPDSWYKFRDIALYWLAKGVDGFRYDMAELVPYEFWSFLNSAIKNVNADAFLMAEVYNPHQYRNYIHLGKMDYLYDKVETYDKLKDIIQGKTPPDGLSYIQSCLQDIDIHMLKFLDNHDEQRLASPEFAGSPEKGKPMMLVSTMISSAPIMIYFGQEVGEAANEDAGFGSHSRTSIFDYIGVPNHQRWMNDGAFDGGKLTQSEKDLRDFYKRLLNFAAKSSAVMGQFQDLQELNRHAGLGYDPNHLYSFLRWSEEQKLIVITNFSSEHSHSFELKIPADIIAKWQLKEPAYKLQDALYHTSSPQLRLYGDYGLVFINIGPLESFIYEIP